MASAVSDLRENVQNLARETEEQNTALGESKQKLEDYQKELDVQLRESATGEEVAEALSAAITSVEEATGQLAEVIQKARDFTDRIMQ